MGLPGAMQGGEAIIIKINDSRFVPNNKAHASW